MGSKTKPPSLYLMANSIPQAKFYRLFRSKVSPDRSHVISPMLMVSIVPPLPKRMHVFTHDLKRLTADLEVADDRATVVQRYNDEFAAKVEVRCKLGQIWVPPCLHIPSLRKSWKGWMKWGQWAPVPYVQLYAKGGSTSRTFSPAPYTPIELIFGLQDRGTVG